MFLATHSTESMDMARGPNGAWRPTDVIGNAVYVGKITIRGLGDTNAGPARWSLSGSPP